MEEQRDYYLYVDKQKVPVSREVFEAARTFARKERYFMQGMKREQFKYDPETQTAVFLPPLETSLENLLDEGAQFEDKDSETPEERHERHKREARAEAEEYYQEVLAEKTAEESSSVSAGSDAEKAV